MRPERALLDAAASALARQDTVHLASRPRMADFARWVTAAEPALSWPEGAFLAAYEANREAVGDAALDGSAIAVTRRFIESVRRHPGLRGVALA